jgi:putative ABC transport system permease protein
MLGIVIGVAAVVCVVAVGEGAQVLVTDQIGALGTNTLYISPGAATSGRARLSSGTLHTLTEDDAAAILRELPEIQIASSIIARRQQVVAGNQNWSTTVTGIDTGFLAARDWLLAEGRMFSSAEMQSGSKVAIIGQVIVDKLFEGRVRLGDSIRIGAVPFTIVGILAKKGQHGAGDNLDDIVAVPLYTARSRIVGRNEVNPHAVDLILVKAEESANLADIKDKLTDLLRQRHRLLTDTADDFSILNPVDVAAAQQRAIEIFGILLTSIASISLLVGGISIMNIMLVSVTERTREIGLRMAVGARRRDISRQFLVESITLALFGGAIGAVIGSLGAMGITFYYDWPILISPAMVLIACGLSTAMGMMFGWYPAYRAARLDPMISLRIE